MHFSMRANLQKYPLMEKLADFVRWVSKDRWQIISTNTVDDLYGEIYQLEKTLSHAPTRPTRIRKAKSLEPITEQQKIMDLAG
jgi:hypothetical protein